MSAITQFVYNLVTHPVHSIGFILSFAAAFGFLIFLRGFLSGAGHLITIDHHDEHLSHARARAIWGVVIMIDAFMLWVVVRVLASFFGGPAINVPLTEWTLGLYAVWQIWAYFMLQDPPKGH